MAALILAIGIPALSQTHRSPAAIRQLERPVTPSRNDESGFLGWLMDLLPEGIRFKGPAVGSGSQRELLATATCFDAVSGSSCNGLRNLKGYLSAVHASQNLGIPFERLQAKMKNGRTLQEAIRELRPKLNSGGEAWRAGQQAQRDLRPSS
jgi:hypothetical protein